MSSEIINNFKEIKIETPVDIIIGQIRELINSGQLKAGDKLPSERQLAEKLGVGRTYVRDAIKKLEFYGILKTLPQKGTVIAGLGITALKGLMLNVMKLEKADFYSLVETRVILEVEAAKLAALRANNESLTNIEEALKTYHIEVLKGNAAVEEDFLFHLSIAEASQNSVIKSLLMIVSPEIMQTYKKLNVCSDGVSLKSYEEHMELFKYIKAKNEKAAQKVMKKHLNAILNFAQNKFINY